MLVGDPNLAAPREDRLSREPGWLDHATADAGLTAPIVHGKPFPDVFAPAAAPPPPRLDPRRVAMVGDTRRIDVLAAAAQGWRTVLVTGHGLLRGLNWRAEVAASGMVPEVVIATT